MAIDVIQDNIISTSTPRISFSIDSETNEDFAYRSDSSSDFDFCVSSNDSATSSADELFSDGLIRPLQLKEKFVISKSFSVPRHQNHQPSLPPLPPPKVHEIAKDQIASSNPETEIKHQSKSFWGIRRSSSLHCDSSHKKSSFWSMPLLSRSNSVPKASRESQKQNSNSKNSKKLTSSASSASSSYSLGYASFYSYPSSSRKSPSRVKHGGGGSTTQANGVRVNPVINVGTPPVNFKGTANLFGFGYLFRNGRDKKNNK